MRVTPATLDSDMRLALALAFALAACRHAGAPTLGNHDSSHSAAIIVEWGGGDDTLGPAPTSIVLEGPVERDLLKSPGPTRTDASPDSWRHVGHGMVLARVDTADLPPGSYQVTTDLDCTPASLTLPITADLTITCVKRP